MTDKRNNAGGILQAAHRCIMAERKNQHGDAEDSFQMIAALWSAYLDSVRPDDSKALTPRDVAHMMTLLKVSRSIHGDPAHADHYVDAAGYQALAGMLAGATPQTAAGGASEAISEIVMRYNPRKAVDPK